MRIVVFGVHEPEPVLFVERDRVQIGVNCQEPTTSLIVPREHPLDIV